jgi:indolepyruvate ferredoxin oxidoreductase
VSHLRFAAGKLDPANRLTPGSADCIVAFDLLTAADTKNLGYGDPAKTISVVSTSKTPTGDMVYDKTIAYPETPYLLNRLGQVSHSVHAFDAMAAAQKLFGNTAAANFLLVGAAYQTGALRIPASSVEEAITINGVAVDANIAAFRWGRLAIADPVHFDDVVSPAHNSQPAPLPARVLEGTTFTGQVGDLIARRAANLVGFQNETLAENYVAVLQSIWTAERALGDRTEFSEAVAKGLYKFTAYKDEYEVARLHSDGEFRRKIEAMFEGDYKVVYHLAPPILSRSDPLTGEPRKMRYGSWTLGLFTILSRLRFLRGSVLDPFGHTRERRMERALIGEYEQTVERVLRGLTPQNHALAIQIASLPEEIRGYGHIKAKSVEAAARRREELLASFGEPARQKAAA